MKKFFLIVVVFSMLVICCVSCRASGPQGQPEYEKGDLVCYVLDGRRAQVLEVRNAVMFEDMSEWVYVTSYSGKNGSVHNRSMYGFELRPCGESENISIDVEE